jgi:large subunit ribosomal protein L1
MPDEKLSGKEKYKLKQQKKAEDEPKEKAQVKGVGLKGGERIKTIGGDTLPEDSDKEKSSSAKKRQPRVRGKQYKSKRSKVDKTKLYSAKDAIKLVKETSYSKFDGTVELHIVVKKKGLNINVDMPNDTGKTKTIEIANEKTIEKLKKGKVDYDVLLATPDMMPKLVPFAKTLGPKGLMPNPKNGTIIKKRADASKFTGSTVNIKTEKKAPLIHTFIGKVSQKQSELEANLEAVISAVGKNKIVKAYLTSTMGPSVKLSI